MTDTRWTIKGFQVFATTYSKVHDPVFARIDCAVDVDGRTARLVVPGVVH